jgi:hypothetical protein
MEKLFQFIVRLTRERFYGTLELKFEKGKVVYARLLRTILPDDFE